MADKQKIGLSLLNSTQARFALTKEQEKKISAMYSNLAKEVEKEAKKLARRTNISSVLRAQYLKDLQKELKVELSKMSSATENLIKATTKSVAEEVAKDNIAFAKQLGLSVEGAFFHVPTDIVNSITSGKLYSSNWTLSKAIWGSNAKVQQDIANVVAKGIALNKSAYDIAVDLQAYVDPKSAKPFDWGKVYPNTNKVVDYNAQRLARTMVSHGYQQALVQTAMPNPFITGFRWESSGSARTCELCASRDGVVYAKDELPLDHPNGMCTYLAEVQMDGYVDRLANWYNGGSDSGMDTYAKALGYKGTKVTDKVGYDYKTAVKTYTPASKSPFNPDTWKFYGNKGGEAEYTKKINDFLSIMNDRMKGKPIASRTTKEGLEGILNSGRFKTTYETGKRVESYTAIRTEIENTIFGVPKTIDAVKRPIYGYVDDGVSKATKKYGDYQIILKDSVKNRSTYSYGDTLNVKVKPFANGEVPTSDNVSNGLPYIYKNPAQMAKQLDYIEAQIHGGVTLADIEKVILPKNVSKSIIAQLEELNIKYTISK